MTTITLNPKSEEKAGGVVQYGPTLFGDQRFQMREHMSKDAIQRYSEAVNRLPAIDVWLDKPKGVYYIIDGYQRTEARLLAYRDAMDAIKDMADGGAKHTAIKNATAILDIQANVHEVSENEALIFAARANFGHGEKLDPEDREKAVLTMAGILGFQVRKIADEVGMHPGTVSRIFQKEKLREEMNRQAKANGRPGFAYDASSAMLFEVLSLPAILAKSQGKTAGKTKEQRGGLSEVEVMAQLATLAFDKKLTTPTVRQAVKWAGEPIYWVDGKFKEAKWLAFVASKATSVGSRDRQLAQITSDLMELAGIKADNSFRKSYTKQDLQVAARAIDKAAAWLRVYGAAITDRIARYGEMQAASKKAEADAKGNGQAKKAKKATAKAAAKPKTPAKPAAKPATSGKPSGRHSYSAPPVPAPDATTQVPF